MSRLTFEEFIKLPRAEQNKRYKELSEHDRFSARMNDWGWEGNGKKMTDEEFEQLKKTPMKGYEEMWDDIVKIMESLR